MNIVVSLFPVLLFLFVLHSLDSYKLIQLKLIIAIILWGILSGFIAYPMNQFMFRFLDEHVVSQFTAPMTEECLKFSIIIFLLYKKRIGFLADSFILGFASGAGFSIIENIFYLNELHSSNMMLWVVRGCGTAIMHGTATAIAAITVQYFVSKSETLKFKYLLLGILPGIVIHSIFNSFFFSPFAQTILQVACLPLLSLLVFSKSEHALKQCMESQFESEFELLQSIRSGQLKDSRAGKYIVSIRDRLPPEIIVDMMAYVSLSVDLSMKAKGWLLLKEAGMPIEKDDDLDSKLKELEFLSKSIGKTGMRTLQPLIHVKNTDLWKLVK